MIRINYFKKYIFKVLDLFLVCKITKDTMILNDQNDHMNSIDNPFIDSFDKRQYYHEFSKIIHIHLGNVTQFQRNLQM